MGDFLDITKKHDVQYCIPLWLRDEQIKHAISIVKDRIQPVPAEQRGDEKCAVVCFGPSLNDTWEQIKDYKYILSCSGSHKFLLDRGLIPTWHVEVDPRAHKVKLIGTPHKDVEYLISSTCHPDVFKHLSGHNVKLWHVFANEDEALRTLPKGEWALTGGSNVGLRALTIARFLGFTDLHIFGMDGCEGKSGKHAAEHPNQPQDHSLTKYNGVEYKTTTAMLECAKQTFHELNQMPGVKATFYGDGLVQAMAKDYVPAYTPQSGFIGFNKPLLISDEYKELNARLHRENLTYGVGGGRHAETILKLAQSIKSQSILDYGCGKGYLSKAIPFPIWEYDPAIPGKDEAPRPADIVVCTDVLEHIEPDMLKFVLDDLRRCTKQVGYFVIHTGPARKTLPDGRNTHLIQQDHNWWHAKLSKFFTVGKIVKAGPELHIMVGPKNLKPVTIANKMMVN
jgi:hypothetical protein